MPTASAGRGRPDVQLSGRWTDVSFGVRRGETRWVLSFLLDDGSPLGGWDTPDAAGAALQPPGPGRPRPVHARAPHPCHQPPLGGKGGASTHERRAAAAAGCEVLLRLEADGGPCRPPRQAPQGGAAVTPWRLLGNKQQPLEFRSSPREKAEC